jgi:elongation factor G
MDDYTAERLRTVALVGHQGSGKTTLSESMLYVSGARDRPGTVDRGSTASDYHPAEVERGMSVFTSLLHTRWDGCKVNVLDTPGYPDFVSEVVAATKVADTAVYVMDARSGVQVGTELAWTYGARTDVPSMFVINHLDQPGVDAQAVVDQIQDRFGRAATPVQVPAGRGSRTVVDLLHMKQVTYDDAHAPTVASVDDALLEQVEPLHQVLVEDIAENDEALLERYLEAGRLTTAELRRGLRAAMARRQLFPIVVTSATDHVGVHGLLDVVTGVTPSPADRSLALHERGGADAGTDDETIAFIYRTMAEEHVGEYSFVRVYRGALTTGQDLENARTGGTERIGQMYAICGQEREAIPQLAAGDVGALVKLKDTATNDTLRTAGSDAVVPPTEFPEPRYGMAVQTVEDGREDRLARGLQQITAEDPSLVVEHSPLLHQVVLRGQGEMHLQIARARLQRRAGVEVEFVRPRIAYRETIRRRARASYRHKKQTGGAGQFADLTLIVEPLDSNRPLPPDVKVRGTETLTTEWDATVELIDAIVGGAIDMRRFAGAIQKGLLEAMAEGPLAGFPVGDLRIVVADGGMHAVDSNEAAFRMAALQGFRKAFREAAPALLEPLHLVTVTTPDAYTGDVISDLNARRGQVRGIDMDGPFQSIEALVPEAELFQYSTALRSITHGRGLHRARYDRHEQAPSHVQDEIVRRSSAGEEAPA